MDIQNNMNVANVPKKRNWIVTVLAAIVIALSLMPWVFLLAFSQSGLMGVAIFNLFDLLVSVLMIISAIGLWRMRRWGLYLFSGVIVVSSVRVVVGGNANLWTFIFLGILVYLWAIRRQFS